MRASSDNKPTRGISRELAYVLHCALALPEPAGPDDLDWDGVAHLAARHRVEGLVAAEAAGAPSLPPAARQRFDELRRVRALVYLAQLAETARLSRDLEDAGIACLALKGCALAETHYAPSPELRTALDVDILVDPRDFGQADRLLREAGYVRTSPGFEPPAASESMVRRLVNAYEYDHAVSGLKVELHHRLLPNPYVLAVPFRELLDGSVEVAIGTGRVRALAGAPLIAYLCAHAAGHAFFRLKWLADIHRAFLACGGERIASTLDRARAWGCGRAVLAALALHERLAGGIGVAVDARKRRLAPLVTHCMREILRPERAAGHRLGDVPDDLNAALYGMRLAEDWPARLFPLLRLLTHPDDTRVLGLGSEWALLYAILGRPLAACRLVGRTLGSQGAAPT